MTLDHYIHHHLPTMEGWCTPEKARRLASIITAVRPAVYVEIGVFAGRSLFAAALALRDNGTGHAVGIDPWHADASVAGFADSNRDWWGKLDHDHIYQLCEATQRQLGLEGVCTLLRQTSNAALWLVRSLAPIGVLHIDGNHSEQSALFDVQAYAPLVPPGGIILFDDLDWATTRKAQAYLATVARLDERLGNCGIYTKL